jgi:Zn-dependent protease with chaperone function
MPTHSLYFGCTLAHFSYPFRIPVSNWIENMPPTTWTGRYLDGRSAAAQRVTIELRTESLQITRQDGSVLNWPYDEVQCTQGAYDGEQIRLEHGSNPTAALVITNPRFLTTLRTHAPQLVAAVNDPTRRGLRLRLTVAAAILTLVVVAIIYGWGIPGLALVVTPHIPIAWEQQLGRQVVDQFSPEKDRCTDPYRKQIIESMLTKLTATMPNNPYGTIHFQIVDDPMVNAFAAPGGYVVVFRGLLEKTETPEQLAGVLAHELQHIFKRHTTRAIVEQTSTSLLIAAVSGDITGAATVALDSARTLGALRYSRVHETEADTEGLKMLLAAGIDPKGMIEFFQIMNKGNHRDDDAGWFRYLSTHPTHDNRVQTLTKLAGSSVGQGHRLLPGLEWSAIRNVCRFKPPKSTEPESSPSSPQS